MYVRMGISLRLLQRNDAHHESEEICSESARGGHRCRRNRMSGRHARLLHCNQASVHRARLRHGVHKTMKVKPATYAKRHWTGGCHRFVRGVHRRPGRGARQRASDARPAARNDPETHVAGLHDSRRSRTVRTLPAGHGVDVDTRGCSTALQRWNRAVRVPQAQTWQDTAATRLRGHVAPCVCTPVRGRRGTPLPCAGDTEVDTPHCGHSYTGRESIE